MSIDQARDLNTNPVRRSGHSTGYVQLKRRPLLRTGPGGCGIRGYKHLTPNRGENPGLPLSFNRDRVVRRMEVYADNDE